MTSLHARAVRVEAGGYVQQRELPLLSRDSRRNLEGQSTNLGLDLTSPSIQFGGRFAFRAMALGLHKPEEERKARIRISNPEVSELLNIKKAITIVDTSEGGLSRLRSRQLSYGPVRVDNADRTSFHVALQLRLGPVFELRREPKLPFDEKYSPAAPDLRLFNRSTGIFSIPIIDPMPNPMQITFEGRNMHLLDPSFWIATQINPLASKDEARLRRGVLGFILEPERLNSELLLNTLYKGSERAQEILEILHKNINDFKEKQREPSRDGETQVRWDIYAKLIGQVRIEELTCYDEKMGELPERIQAIDYKLITAGMDLGIGEKEATERIDRFIDIIRKY